MSTVGLTKDQGWQIGVRRTLAAAPLDVWEVLVTQPGMSLWLGRDDDLVFAKGATFQTEDGTTGRVVSCTEGRLIRLRHCRRHEEPTTIQVRVNGAGAKSVLSFHQERLRDADHREQMRAHWSAVVDALEDLL